MTMIKKKMERCPMPLDWKNIVKMSILLKEIYRFNVIPLEKEMAEYSSILAWKIPRAAEPGRLLSMGSQRVGHDWATSLFHYQIIHDIFHRIRIKNPKIYVEPQKTQNCQGNPEEKKTKLEAKLSQTSDNTTKLLLLSHFSCVWFCATP